MAQVGKFLEVWGRVKDKTGISTLTHLAELVETTHQYVSRKKAKDEFPVSWAFIIAQRFNLSTDWIMTGEYPKRINEGAEINPLLVEVNEWLNEGEKHKSADFRILFQQQMIRAFFDYEEWKLRKEESETKKDYSSSRKVA